MVDAAPMVMEGVLVLTKVVLVLPLRPFTLAVCKIPLINKMVVLDVELVEIKLVPALKVEPASTVKYV